MFAKALYLHMAIVSKHKRNTLLRIIKIQNITIEHTQKGVSQQWVYDKIIYPTFCISIGTYYRYLSTPAKQLLKRLEAVA